MDSSSNVQKSSFGYFEAWPTYNLPIEGPYTADSAYVGSVSNTTLSELYERVTSFIDARHDADGTYIYKTMNDSYGTDTQALVDEHLLATPPSAGHFNLFQVPVVPTPASELLSKTDSGLVQAMIKRERENNYAALTCVNVKSIDYIRDMINEYLLLSTQKLTWMKGVIEAPTVALLDPKRMINEMERVSIDDNASASEESTRSLDADTSISRSANTPAIQMFNTTLTTQNHNDTVAGARIPMTFGVTFRLVAILDKTGRLRYGAHGHYAPRVVPESLLDGDKLLYTTEIICDPFDYGIMKFMRVFEKVRKMDLDKDPYEYQNPQRYSDNLERAVDAVMNEFIETKGNNTDLTSVADYLRKCLDQKASRINTAPTIMTDLAARAGERLLNEYYNNVSLPNVTPFCAWGRTRIVLTPRMGWAIDEPVVDQKKIDADNLNTEAINAMWNAYKGFTNANLEFYQADPQSGRYLKVGRFKTTFQTLHPRYSKIDLLYSINMAAWVLHVYKPFSLEPLEMLRKVYDSLALISKDQFQDLLSVLAISMSRLFIINAIEFLKTQLRGPIAHGLAMIMLDISTEESSKKSVEAFRDYYQMVVEHTLRQINLPDVGDTIFRAVMEQWPFLKLRQVFWTSSPAEPNAPQWVPPFSHPNASAFELGIPSATATLYDTFLGELTRMQTENPGELLNRRSVPKGEGYQVLWNDFSKYNLFLLRRQVRGLDTPGKFSLAAFDEQLNNTLERDKRQSGEVRYEPSMDLKGFTLIYAGAVKDTLAIMKMSVDEMVKRTGHYITPKNSVRGPVLSPVSLIISGLVITQHLMDSAMVYPNQVMRKESDLTESIQRGHSALITLINHRDGVVVPKNLGFEVFATSLKWHRATVSSALTSPSQRELHTISHLVNGSKLTISKLALYAGKKKASTSPLASGLESTDPNTQSESESESFSRRRRMTERNESGLIACIMERLYNLQGIKREAEAFPRLWSPMQSAAPPLLFNRLTRELYYPWTLQYEERLSIFITAIGFSLGVSPNDLPNELPLLEAQRLQRILQSECDPARNRAFGLLDGMASFFDDGVDKSKETANVSTDMEIPQSLMIVGYEKAAVAKLKAYTFDFPNDPTDADLAEWLHTIVAGIYIICMTLDIDVLRLTSPLAWLSIVCSSMVKKSKPDNDFEDMDILLESYFGSMMFEANAAPFAVYYLNLPLMYADEFDGGQFYGKVFQTLHSFLRAKDVDYDAINTDEEVKQSVRNIDFTQFIKSHLNLIKKTKSEFKVLREQRLIYWITRFEEHTTTIPSIISIIRHIMHVD